jgi:hypothetical protein
MKDLFFAVLPTLFLTGLFVGVVHLVAFIVRRFKGM